MIEEIDKRLANGETNLKGLKDDLKLLGEIKPKQTQDATGTVILSDSENIEKLREYENQYFSSLSKRLSISKRFERFLENLSTTIWNAMVSVHIFFDIRKAQMFEYIFAHMMDKNFESFFNFLHVLPGAWSAYRYKALT